MAYCCPLLQFIPYQMEHLASIFGIDCLTDYLELLDWTGRSLSADKRGAIPEQLAPILTRLDLNADRLRSFPNRRAAPTTRLRRPVRNRRC